MTKSWRHGSTHDIQGKPIDTSASAVYCLLGQDGGGVVPPRGGDRLTLQEIIAILMLIIAVINLVITITKKKK